MIKEVIFDCFGVLTQDGWLAFLQKYGNNENIEELRYLNHQADRGMIDYQEFLKQICKLTKASKQTAHKMISASYEPNEHIFNLIKQLKKHYKLGVISNVGSPLETYLPEKLLRIFDQQTLSYQVGWIKPEPNIFQAHLEKSGVKPEEAVFIDDRLPNIDGAHAAGMNGIWYQDYGQLTVELAALGVKIPA